MAAPLARIIKPTRLIPNSDLPVLLYTLGEDEQTSAEDFEVLFRTNGWTPQWRFPMYNFSHYHSTSHECLGVFAGEALVRLGVSDKEDAALGYEQRLVKGNVLVLPAGVAHRAISATENFAMVGAYPEGCHWDMCYEGTPVVKGLKIPPDPTGASHLPKLWETIGGKG